MSKRKETKGEDEPEPKAAKTVDTKDAPFVLAAQYGERLTAMLKDAMDLLSTNDRIGHALVSDGVSFDIKDGQLQNVMNLSRMIDQLLHWFGDVFFKPEKVQWVFLSPVISYHLGAHREEAKEFIAELGTVSSIQDFRNEVKKFGPSFEALWIAVETIFCTTPAWRNKIIFFEGMGEFLLRRTNLLQLKEAKKDWYTPLERLLESKDAAVYTDARGEKFPIFFDHYTKYVTLGFMDEAPKTNMAWRRDVVYRTSLGQTETTYEVEVAKTPLYMATQASVVRNIFRRHPVVRRRAFATARASMPRSLYTGPEIKSVGQHIKDIPVVAPRDVPSEDIDAGDAILFHHPENPKIRTVLGTGQFIPQDATVFAKPTKLKGAPFPRLQTLRDTPTDVVARIAPFLAGRFFKQPVAR